MGSKGCGARHAIASVAAENRRKQIVPLKCDVIKIEGEGMPAGFFFRLDANNVSLAHQFYGSGTLAATHQFNLKVYRCSQFDLKGTAGAKSARADV